MDLAVMLIGMAIVTATIYGSYRLFVAALVKAASFPWVGKIATAETDKGVDRFRFSLGNLFHWNVSVNAEKGTVGGSMQIGAPKGWLALGALVALGAALLIRGISGLLLPAALVAVAVGFARKAWRGAVARSAPNVAPNAVR